MMAFNLRVVVNFLEIVFLFFRVEEGDDTFLSGYQ